MSRSDIGDAQVFELNPTAMGGQGDAIADWQGHRVFVPFALPGERVRAAVQPKSGGEFTAGGVEVLAAAADRIAPACRHFGICGGCKLQHWREAAYRAWKTDLVRQALQQHGLAMPAQIQAIFLPPGTRRRAEFAAAKRGGQVLLGFQEARGHRIVDQQECPILIPSLVQLAPPLRAALKEMLAEGQSVDILATASASGFDLLIGGDKPPTQRQRTILASFAAAEGIARIAWNTGRGEPEPLAMLRQPQVYFGAVAVDLPMPSFLQPSEAGEAALRSALLAMLGKPKRIAELYAGSGTFTFDLARRAPVHAVEGNKPALKALELAARRAQLSHRITVEARDLERSPVGALELKKYDTIVFDPPRAGARSQSSALAKCAAGNIVAISCNPATFARDARTLAEGGYRMTAMTVVDQFIWSPHVEIVARFQREG